MLMSKSIDSNSAWVFKTQSICAMYKSRFQEPTSYQLVLPLLGSKKQFLNTRLEQFCCKPLFRIACDLLHLTTLLGHHECESHKIGLTEREYFEDNFAVCQHSLASFPHPFTVLIKSTMLYRQECFRLALIIYFNSGIRVTPSPKFLNTMKSGLIKACQESTLSDSWHPFSDILLSILFIGYCGSGDPAGKGWFVHTSKIVVRTLKLKSLFDSPAMNVASRMLEKEKANRPS